MSTQPPTRAARAAQAAATPPRYILEIDGQKQSGEYTGPYSRYFPLQLWFRLQMLYLFDVPAELETVLPAPDDKALDYLSEVLTELGRPGFIETYTDAELDGAGGLLSPPGSAFQEFTDVVTAGWRKLPALAGSEHAAKLAQNEERAEKIRRLKSGYYAQKLPGNIARALVWVAEQRAEIPRFAAPPQPPQTFDTPPSPPLAWGEAHTIRYDGATALTLPPNEAAAHAYFTDLLKQCAPLSSIGVVRTLRAAFGAREAEGIGPTAQFMERLPHYIKHHLSGEIQASLNAPMGLLSAFRNRMGLARHAPEKLDPWPGTDPPGPANGSPTWAQRLITPPQPAEHFDTPAAKAPSPTYLYFSEELKVGQPTTTPPAARRRTRPPRPVGWGGLLRHPLTVAGLYDVLAGVGLTTAAGELTELGRGAAPRVWVGVVAALREKHYCTHNYELARKCLSDELGVTLGETTLGGYQAIEAKNYKATTLRELRRVLG